VESNEGKMKTLCHIWKIFCRLSYLQG